ncbi:MAG: hypothetical protein LBJ87_03080 [bacterium]|jgi:hypothetical protein|nr:hypothetical protein [bacterium]
MGSLDRPAPAAQRRDGDPTRASLGEVMKALTVRQPWASHLVHSGKDVEKRA